MKLLAKLRVSENGISPCIFFFLSYMPILLWSLHKLRLAHWLECLLTVFFGKYSFQEDQSRRQMTIIGWGSQHSSVFVYAHSHFICDNVHLLAGFPEPMTLPWQLSIDWKFHNGIIFFSEYCPTLTESVAIRFSSTSAHKGNNALRATNPAY